MSEIINDWEQFCEGRKSYDKSHFYTLFWEGIILNDLETKFKYFPKSITLVERVSEYLFGKREDVLPESSVRDVLINLAVRDIEERKSIIDSDSSLFNSIQNLEIKFTEDYESVLSLKAKSPDIDFFDAVNDVLSECWIIEDKKAFALYEAFYGLTKDYEMVWYLFSPLFKTNVDWSYYYRLTTLGGIYSIANKQLFISKKA